MRIVSGRSAVRDVQDPITWAGPDRVLLDDVTVYGLRRMVIVRKGEEAPALEDWLTVARSKAQEREVYFWMFERDGFNWLWIAWKEG